MRLLTKYMNKEEVGEYYCYSYHIVLKIDNQRNLKRKRLVNGYYLNKKRPIDVFCLLVYKDSSLSFSGFNTLFTIILLLYLPSRL